MATLWNQTSGTSTATFGTAQIGAGALIKTGQSSIGATLTSFSLYLKNSSSVDQSLTFGVWASGNTTSTPTSTFTGSIDNINDLTTSITEYTFTGSHTLADGDNIGVYWFTGSSAQYIQMQYAASGGQADTNLTIFVSSWGDYGHTPPNMHAQGSGGPITSSGVMYPPNIAMVNL